MTLHRAPHESHESHASHDSPSFHSTHALPSSNIQNTIFPGVHTITHFRRYTLNPNSTTFTSRCTCPTSINSSPSKSRKRKSNAAGRGSSGCKRQRVPAPIVTAPTSTVCGIGPAVPVTTLLSDDDPPSPSPQLATITVQPPIESSQTRSGSTQLPSASYSSLRANRKGKERSSSVTDVWYFCRTSNSEIKPAEPLPDPCERVFSSSKETCALPRSLLSAGMSRS
jgi:hypothetical protein